MTDRRWERQAFTVGEATEIRRLLDDQQHARRAVQRMSLARLRHMQLGIAAEPHARPTRAQFEELVASGELAIDEDGGTAKAVIRPHPSGNVFRVAVGVSGQPVPETWSAFDQRYQWFGKRPQRVTSGAHLFVLAVGRWKSAVIGLYEAVTAGADKLPSSPDNERWPWALGVRPLAAIAPPDAERVEGQRGPQSGLPERIPNSEAVERLYEALADSPPPPGPTELEQRVQELEWQDVAPDVLEAVRSLGREAREHAVLPRAIELGDWSEEELQARAWHTGTGVVSHIEHIVRQALKRELDLTRHLQRVHGVYSVAATAPDGGFGAAYRRAVRPGDDSDEELPTHLADLSELDRATKRHKALQDRLADALRARAIEPRSPVSPQPQFDLAFEHAGKRFVVEVKGGDPVSTQQLRLGTGQLLEYRHLLDGADASQEVQAILLIEGPPPHPWSSLAADAGVRLLRADRLEASLSELLSFGDGASRT